MHAESTMRKYRILTFIISALALSGCGQGDGPESIPGTAATPLPTLPPGFCDAINFEILCPPPSCGPTSRRPFSRYRRSSALQWCLWISKGFHWSKRRRSSINPSGP